MKRAKRVVSCLAVLCLLCSSSAGALEGPHPSTLSGAEFFSKMYACAAGPAGEAQRCAQYIVTQDLQDWWIAEQEGGEGEADAEVATPVEQLNPDGSTSGGGVQGLSAPNAFIGMIACAYGPSDRAKECAQQLVVQVVTDCERAKREKKDVAVHCWY